MKKIFEIKSLIEFKDSLKDDFNILARDFAYLEEFYEIIDAVETWRHSTGPIFDYPPFSSEMMGFDGGRLIKRSYSDIDEARVKGAYSSGFVGGKHVVTVSPSKPITSALTTTFFKDDGDEKTKHTIKYYKKSFKEKLPALVSIDRVFYFDHFTKAKVGVGAGAAYSIFLYYHDEHQRIVAASMVTAPYDFQTDYEMHYDEEGLLDSITSGGVVWKRKEKN
jgi:hypothetical protein